MPTIIQYKGYSIYFTSHCINEAIHFHINKGAPIEAGSAKVWILSNGTKTEGCAPLLRSDSKALWG